MKKGVSLFLALILVLSISFASSGLFDIFKKTEVSGEVIAPTYIDEDSYTESTPIESNLDLSPRVSFWCGKVNQHNENGIWKTDSDGISGCDINKLNYCKKFYPETTRVEEDKYEFIIGWRDRGNVGDYNSTKMTYKCLSEPVKKLIEEIPIVEETIIDMDEQFDEGLMNETLEEDENALITCEDSDGGVNLEIKGNFKQFYKSISIGRKDDSCFTVVKGIAKKVKSCEGNYPDCFLVETSCKDETNSKIIKKFKYDSKIGAYLMYVNCVNGCNDGACVKEEKLIDNENAEECDGCLIEGNCFPSCYRKGENYCSFEGELKSQLVEGEACDNDCECESNFCVNGECVSEATVKKVFNWFKRVFGGNSKTQIPNNEDSGTSKYFEVEE